MKEPQDQLRDRLFAEGFRFEFFQAVRLLERLAQRRRKAEGATDLAGGSSVSAAVGQDLPPTREAVRFRSSAALSFASAPIASVSTPRDAPPDTQPEMAVTFMGLTGPNGALPQHYTSLVIEQQREKDTALRDFYDLFGHRLVSLFYRAWEKYRLASAYERSKLEAAGDGVEREDSKTSHAWAGADPMTSALLSLVGLATGKLQGRLPVSDEALVYYGGHFARRQRSAASLELILSDCFGVTTRVEQFVGRWFALERPDRSRLAGRSDREASNCRLGQSTVVGEKVWDVQSRFRIRMGPLRYEQYCRFLPGGAGLRRVCELTRAYVGMEFEFDVQPVLMADEVPCAERGSAAGGRLGANLWLASRPAKKDFESGIFACCSS